MCGIFGFYAPKLDGPSIEVLDRCRDAMRHRGPDAKGRFQDQGLYFGFRRLAILDLSVNGGQPMSTADGRYTIIFNGEIYNYIELREQLESLGEVFRGGSDTEVLLRLYARRGLKCLSELNGMFAFGLYDRQERTVLLVRDRLGVKPLLYWRNQGRFAFASEAKAFEELDLAGKRVNEKALGMYFAMGWVPAWTSVADGMEKLPPGTWLKVLLQTGECTGPVQFWQLPSELPENGCSEEEWIQRVDLLLSDATRIRLRADVPVGVFLSGGIDSSLVTAAARENSENIRAFTVAFPGEEIDECEEASAIARHLGVAHSVVNLQLDRPYEMLEEISRNFDEPFGDPSAIPTFLICAEARKRFTVVLSGDGGDEAFAGYSNHLQAMDWRWLRWAPRCVAGAVSGIVGRFSAPDSRMHRLSRRISPSAGLFGIGGKAYPYTDWRRDVLEAEFVVSAKEISKGYRYLLGECARTDLLDQAQRTDLRVYMLEDILPKVDLMSMRCSLEVRSPFLDYRLVEMALSIPTDLRIRAGRGKYLLRRIADRKLPARTANGVKKGFGVPLRTWLYESHDSGRFHECLVQPEAGIVDPFRPGGAERLWQIGKGNPNMLPYVYCALTYRWWCSQNRR